MAHTAIKIASAAACSLLLTACTLFGAKSDYEQAQETRPLEIPPDLDSPSANRGRARRWTADRRARIADS